MVSSQARRRRGRPATIAAAALITIAVAALVYALSHGDAPSSRAARTPAGGASGPALYVGGKGCSDSRSPSDVRHSATPWCTLRHAAAAAPAGSAISVAPGRYPALSVTSGSGGLDDNVTFRSRDPRRRPQLAGLTMTHVNGATVQGFAVTGTLNLIGTNRVTVRDNDFNGGNLYLRQTRATSVVNNRFRHVYGGKRALLAQGSYAKGQPTTRDLVVRGNRFDDIRHDAIALYNGYEHATVERNTIAGVTRPPNFPLHSDSMQFMGGDRLTVRGNVLHDDAQGILVKDGSASTHLIVEDNLITRIPHGAGLQLFNAPGAVVRNNTVWGTAYGTIFDNDVRLHGRTAVQLNENVLDQLTVVPDRTARVTGGGSNVFGRGRPYGQPAYRGTPNFMNARGGDLRVRRGSPGAGLPGGKQPPGAQKRVAR
jgi:hypothetical protein